MTNRAYWTAVGLVASLAACPAANQAAERTFNSPSCRVTFSHPTDWDVVADTSDPATPCGFTLRPLDWGKRLAASDSVDLFTVLIRATDSGVWSQAPLSGFERRPESWVVLGRHGVSTPADSLSGSGLQGLRGVAQSGCFREGGGYAGLCDTPMAILGTSVRSVLIIGAAQAEGVFARLIATLRLDP